MNLTKTEVKRITDTEQVSIDSGFNICIKIYFLLNIFLLKREKQARKAPPTLKVYLHDTSGQQL